MIEVIGDQYLLISIKDSTHAQRTKKSKTSKVKVTDSREVPLPETDYIMCLLNLKTNLTFKTSLENTFFSKLLKL